MPKSQRLSDATLVRRSQQGDRKSFGALVSRYDRRLRGLAHALLLDRNQMDAALGLAYLRAWRDVVRIKPRDEIGPWLYRAVYNACIDELRRNGSRPAPVGAAAGQSGLRTALAALAPADRVAVVLVEREGFSVTSAARILGVTPDELETRLDVARDHLAPHVPDPPPATESATDGATAGDEGVTAEDEADDDEATADVAAAAVMADEDADDEATADVAVDGASTEAAADDEAAEVAEAATTDDGATEAATTDDGATEDESAATDDVAAVTPDENGDEPAAAAADGASGNGHESAPTNGRAADGAPANGHKANRGRGRRARRRANGVAGTTARPTEADDVAPAAEVAQTAAPEDPAESTDGDETPGSDAVRASAAGEHRASGPVTST